MREWTALWAIKIIPGGAFEVIRDGRPVGIPRCDDFAETIGTIVHHRLYNDWDRVVCRDHRGEEWDVDVADYDRELVGA